MPRERSTWNVNAIAKRAGLKVADPYLMNQDHVNQQPAADAYVIGGPSDFAEDVHPSNTTWEAEYAGGQVKRNEIGMPEMRSDTFNHPEKTASAEVITKKAALCVAIARKILPKTASSAEIEDQSYSFMYLPDAEVMATYTRLAADQDQQEQSQQQQVQASQQQGQQVQAGQIPPQFLENVKKKKEEAADKKDDGEKKEEKKAAQQDQVQQDQVQDKQAQQDQGQQDQGQAQQKQAQQDQGQQDQVKEKQAAMQQQLAQLIQQAQQIQQQLAQGQQQTQQPVAQAQTQQPVAQMQQQSQAQQIAQAVQQAIANGQDPVQAAQQCMGQSQQQGGQQQAQNEIDQMLAEQGQIEPMADMDIQLDTPSMDVGEIQLSPGEDDTLRQLFANNPEYKNAQEAAGQGQDDQGQQGQQKQAHVVRTASMRTVGTRPTAGVSQIGGVSSNAGAATGRDLSSIWNSAPDVREVFGMRTDQ